MRFLFTCGGTAGHINPAIAVAEKLSERFPGSEFLFIGVKGKMEEELVPKSGYTLKTIDVDNISRSMSFSGIRHNAATVAKLPAAIAASKKIMREFKPDAVIGTGGYVCFPVLKAAHELHIPTAMHESNAYPGLTTRMLADSVDKVMVGLEQSRDFYKHPEKIVLTGTPVRRDFLSLTKENARRELNIPKDKKLVVSVWGSLGSGHMNSMMRDFVPLVAENDNICFIHSAGKLYYDALAKDLNEADPHLTEKNVDVRQYIFNMPQVMAAADVVMCRAGASTIAELTAAGKPVIMVPSPNVTENHQEKNARVLEKAGGAVVLLEGEFDAASLNQTLCSLLEDDIRLEQMSKAMLTLSVPDACDKIADIILSLCGKN